MPTLSTMAKGTDATHSSSAGLVRPPDLSVDAFPSERLGVMVELNRSNFREVVGGQGIVLIEGWAPGCGACRQLDPVFASVAEQNVSHTFARMNLQTDDRLGEFFEITHTPCIMLYRDGLLLLKKPGNFSEEELQDILRQAESLDMDMVREELERSPEPEQEKENDDG